MNETRCQVFTPPEVVEEMLDIIGYVGASVFGKRIIENSCGDGNILCSIVQRYIAGLSGESLEFIKTGLERDIVGYDIDPRCCQKTKERLDDLALSYGIENISWNISCLNALQQNDENCYDYVVGNPPYISYRTLDTNTREELRKQFSSCKQGAFDYCYAFIEQSIKSLKTGGKMIYLIPSSIFKNVHGQLLRDMMLDHVNEIHDYTSKKLFGKYLTSSALISLTKGDNTESIMYRNIVTGERINVPKTELKDKWVFIRNSHQPVRFGDYFSASMVIATLLNSAFVISEFAEMDDMLTVRGAQVEKKATRKAISPRAIRNNRTERIIFPYSYDSNGCLRRYTEEEFMHEYPRTYEYLCSFKEQLQKRDSDKQALWFEYGRSQALQRINQAKLLLSTVVTGRVEVYWLDVEDVPYAGIIITEKKEIPLEIAYKVLKSDEFMEYVKSIGTCANGNSIRITSKDIENYRFASELLCS